MYYDIHNVLLGTKFVSTIRNREVSAIGRVLKYYINSPSIGTALSVHYMEVSIKGGSTVVPIGLHCTLVGGIDCCKDKNVMCWKPGMAGSATKARSHDEGRGGRSITGVHGECNC